MRSLISRGREQGGSEGGREDARREERDGLRVYAYA